MRVAALLLGAMLTWPAPAYADEGGPWRTTSPRVRLTAAAGQLELVIPAGRARGVTSRAIPLEPGATYLAAARLELDTLIARGAFLRIALYPRADGTGRQRTRLDSAWFRQGADDALVWFEAPAWARAAKIRVLARPDARRAGIVASIPELVRLEREPIVVLRPDE